MIHKPFAEVTIDDIFSLKEDGIEEGKSIDFKKELNIQQAGARKEFASDVSSFANTVGGDLIIGVSEEQGVITSIEGIDVPDKDQMRQQLESSLRDLVAPQIMGVDIDFYPVGEKFILHIRIPQSYNGPHVVNKERFYGRNNSGKYPLDYVEIKQRFLLSSQVREEIKQYHIERIMKAKADEGYFETTPGASILINIVPIQSFAENVFISALVPQRFRLATLFGSGYDPKIQFEGIAGINNSSYHHLNRQGVIEILDKRILEYDKDTIPAKNIVERILRTLPSAFHNLLEVGLNGPYVISTALLDVKDRIVLYNEQGFSKQSMRTNDMIFPSILITDPSDLSEYDTMLKELFMNAAGYFQTQYSL
ncbi:AlbA family DNA-binding domain-containing protein [Domibacillus robiginosus]|uniref:AlbA family DNA-binding domain-containing protein n=1 Tax=Domibacillus robiginosus TaxID=1071054 RepID=UPI00067E45CD|nr:ATP-binding protein [Domibacillus robiginosus]